MRTKYKRWALPFLKEHKDIAFPTFNEDNPFYKKKFDIEIGGGKGDFIVSQAQKFPDRKFIMIERVISVAAPAVKKIIDNDIKNVLVIYDNFINVASQLKSGSVNNIYLNFSDPWPKKKHAKRRLTSPLFLNDYHRILTKNGRILFKTDQENLYLYTKSVIDNKNFCVSEDVSNYNKLFDDDSLTEYEKKFRSNNKTIYRLVIKKL